MDLYKIESLEAQLEAAQRDVTYYKYVAEVERKNCEYAQRRLRELVQYIVDNYAERSDS